MVNEIIEISKKQLKGKYHYLFFVMIFFGFLIYLSSFIPYLYDFSYLILNILLPYLLILLTFKIVYQEEITINGCLQGFDHFFKIILLNIYIYVLLALWSLLFIFPAIYKAYSYSFANHYLINDPSLSIFDCLKKSKELTKGKKFYLFHLGILVLWPVILLYLGLGLYLINNLEQNMTQLLEFLDISSWIIYVLSIYFQIIYYQAYTNFFIRLKKEKNDGIRTNNEI